MTLKNVLDQRRLWIAPRISDIDDERYPTIVEDSLQGVSCVRGQPKKK